MADLALGLAKSTVEGTLSLVKTAMTEEDNLQMAVKKDLMLMTDEFEMMRSFLTVSKGRGTGDDMARTLVRQVRDMSLDMEDCVEYVVQYTDKSSWLRRLLPRWHCLPAARPVMCLDEAVENIELLKARVESLGQRKMRYNHVGESAPKSAERTHQQAMAFKTTSQGQFVRRNIDGKVNTRREEVNLVHLIIDEKLLNDAIVVWATRSDVGITLISKAFDHTEVLENFLYRAWVQVKQPFNSLEFIQSVLAQFFFYNEDEPLGIKDLVGMETDHCLLMEEYLKRVEVQKYLIVIEGISSIVDWESVLPYLPARDDGRSRILVYTQQPEIASHIVQCPRRISHLYDTDPSVYVMYQTEEEEHENLIKKTKEAIEEYACEWLEKYRYIGPDTYDSFERSVEKMACLGHVHSIWGIPGVGKSFIAEYIYRTRIKKYADRETTGEFTMFGWTHVYRPLNLKELASELFQDLQPISFEEKSILRPDDPIEWCRQFLQANAYCLIVIDGVESTDEWDLIKHAIAFGETRSTFIVTTREENVAKYCATSPELVWNVKCLEAHHAFDLYKDEAYGPRFVLNHLQTRRMKFILEKCGGLPQMTVTVARYLRYDILKPEDSLRWIRLCDRFVHELHNSDELRGLFNWMDSYLQTFPDLLKPCLFYLSVFPPKISIRRSRLMRRWIAEGYCRDANQEQEETALEMFRQLAKMNVILQHIWSEIVIMPLCRLNGFFREYMKSKSMEEDLVFALEGRHSKDLKSTGRHLTVGKKWDRNEIEFKRINQFRLRSLTVYGRWESFLISRSMRVLRVLDLEGTSGVRDVDVENMVTWLPRLRFLSLRGCRDVTHLPKSLADLTLLETLDIRGTSISKLPKTIIKLKKLRYIRAGTLAQLCDDTCTSHTEAAAVENSSPPSITVQSMPPTKPVAPEGSNTPSSSVIESIPPSPPPPPPQPMVTASASSSIAGESLPETATTVTLTESSSPAVAAEAATTRVSSSSATVPPSTVSTGRQQRCSFLSKFSKSTEVAGGSHKGGVTVPKEVFDELFALHTLGVVNISGVGCKATFEGLKYLMFLHKLGVSGINPSNSQEFFGAISGLMRLQSLSVELDKDNQAGCFDNTSMPPNSLESLKLSGITECEMPEWISELPVLRKLSLQVMKILRNENFIICKSKVPEKLEILRLCLTGGGEFRFHRNEKIFKMQQFVHDPGYLKVLDIACNSKLKAIKSPSRFAPFIRVLKFRCCGVKSSLYLCDEYVDREGHYNNPIRRMMKLEEVWLGGTYDVAFKEYLESAIASSYRPCKPVLRLVEEELYDNAPETP